MKTRECIVVCVAIVSIVFLMVASVAVVKISDRIDDLTEVLSQPGITSTVAIEKLEIRNATDDISVSVTGFEAELNSRLLDLLLTAAVADD